MAERYVVGPHYFPIFHARVTHDGGFSWRSKIGDTAPDFEAETTEGKIRFHDWIGNNWVGAVLAPKDFTPVCTTELGTMARLKPEFDKRGVKIIGLSVDPVTNHTKWAQRHQGRGRLRAQLSDDRRHRPEVSKLYGMLPASTGGTSEGRTPADNQTVRNVFIIGPDKKIKLVLVYPMTTGRNFDEVLRVIDSLQLTAKHRVATPANWKQGEDVILTGAVTDEEAKKLYPQGWKSRSPISASCRSRTDPALALVIESAARPRSFVWRTGHGDLRHQQHFADILAVLNKVMRKRRFIEAESPARSSA